ncbi:hypothetical protein CYQ63_13380 [Enterococcus faecium]|nr:hypothetical protein CYQ63_13380 [Enterococcus faecium]
MFLWLKTLYRKRAVTWPFIFYTIIWTLSKTTIYYFVKLRNRLLFCVSMNFINYKNYFMYV